MATMNSMNKVNASTQAKAVTLDKVYTTKQVCEILNVSYAAINNYLHRHPDFKPVIKIKGNRGRDSFMWTDEEVNRFRKHHNRKSKKSISKSTTLTTSAQTTTLTTPQTNTLVDMFNEFINIEAEESKNENRAANRKFRSLFERMTEKDMQNFFAPMLERFKYAFITKNVNNIQSQTLTCIRSGKLKGISKYQLTYSAFLELCKFAAENNCPLNLPTTEA